MAIKDKFLRWLFVNVIQSKMLRMDIPGALLMEDFMGKEKVLTRAVVLPESFYVDLENRLDDKESAEILYAAGKKGGWEHARAAQLSNLDENSEGEVKKSNSMYHRFIETLWAKRMDFDFDFEKKTYRLEVEDWSICRKNGKGFIFTEGAIAGVIAYVFSDPEMECMHTKCQGRGDDTGVVVGRKRGEFDREERTADPDDLGFSDKYYQLNRPRQPKFATNSAQDLINDKVLKHENGIISYEGERLVWTEIHFPYYVELLLHRNGKDEVMFKTAFESGKRLTEGENNLSFLSNFLSALGWGDIYPKNRNEIKISGVPWAKFVDEFDFSIMRGLFSGVVSSITGEEVTFNEYKAREGEDFSLILYGD